jgi:ElaB/YqjD/DUF883 family membrane-anchored ribosome-binding protein
MEFSKIGEMFSNAGVAGILAVIVLYLLHYTLPRQQREFKELLKESHDINKNQASEFREMLESQRTAFMEALGKERDSHANAGLAMVTAVEGVKEEIKTQTVAITNALVNSKR